MFSDPTSIVSKSVNRVKIGDENATYRSADGTTQLRISHQTAKNRKRSMVRVDVTKVAADPLTAVNQQLTYGAYLVFDKPLVGVTSSELTTLYLGLAEMLGADSSANLVKLLSGES